MIETLSLRNFKVFREVDVPLRPLTAIVGPNASGKSTILQALALVFNQNIPEVQARVIPQGRRKGDLKSIGRPGGCSLRCSGRVGSAPIAVEVVITDNDEWEWKSEKPLPKKLLPCAVAYLDLDPRKLAAPSPQSALLVPEQDGRGLASALANLHLEHLPRFQALVENLSRVVPSVEDLRVRSLTDGFELLVDMHGATGVPAYAASAGTLLSLGLLTILTAKDPPKLVLIEDLERGLHPKALQELIGQLRLIQNQVEDLQIIATSHSPYLLDSFAAEEILLTSLDDNGHGQVRCLADHPDYKRWKDLMAPGEFWSSVGESWPTKDRKATAA